MFLDNNFLYKKLFNCDLNNREINLYKITNVKLTGQNIFYPNCLLIKDGEIINPIDEKIMSLKDVIPNNNGIVKDNEVKKFCNTPVFYFIYNTDNYYHFIYDTLPYLISFKNLKKEVHNLKLLMNYPNEQSDNFYPFVVEFLKILGIDINYDVILADNKTFYYEVFVSSSYTHGIDSNLPPRQEIYDLYKNIVKVVNETSTEKKDYPKKIYVSRRSWLHNDFTNIGTNYTTRRKLMNEDDLVETLKKLGYVEVFTEKLTTIEKVKLFSQVESVIGSIGGGMCNVLFSNTQTKVIPIVSPTFLDVNGRFVHSFSKVNVSYFDETSHTSKDKFKKYMRVKCGDIIGEVIDVSDDELIINYSKNFVAGWNNQIQFDSKKLSKKDCTPLDNGLNSEWTLNLNTLIKKYLL